MSIHSLRAPSFPTHRRGHAAHPVPGRPGGGVRLPDWDHLAIQGRMGQPGANQRHGRDLPRAVPQVLNLRNPRENIRKGHSVQMDCPGIATGQRGGKSGNNDGANRMTQWLLKRILLSEYLSHGLIRQSRKIKLKCIFILSRTGLNLKRNPYRGTPALTNSSPARGTA